MQNVYPQYCQSIVLCIGYTPYMVLRSISWQDTLNIVFVKVHLLNGPLLVMSNCLTEIWLRPYDQEPDTWIKFETLDFTD